MKYKVVISPKMREVEDLLLKDFVGMNHCVCELQENLVIEVPRDMCENVRAVLKRKYRDVVLIKNAYLLMEDLHGFIMVKPLITESPIFEEEGVRCPGLEKLLVDHVSDKEYGSLTDVEIQKEFQRAFELYPVNTSRLFRYAGRKGKQEEIKARVARVDLDRVSVIRTIQDCFKSEPVVRAWLFGSFSRMEEKPESDIDILVDLDKSVPIGLFRFAGISNTLEKQLGKRVDLVENGSVKPFAAESINQDKILIYERA